MGPMDWFDLFPHGAPWVWLLVATVIWLRGGGSNAPTTRLRVVRRGEGVHRPAMERHPADGPGALGAFGGSTRCPTEDLNLSLHRYLECFVVSLRFVHQESYCYQDSLTRHAVSSCSSLLISSPLAIFVSRLIALMLSYDRACAPMKEDLLSRSVDFFHG